jgi:RHH-type proline utilization regulon transcriptional repressor/proline dehydrogenase/delta 1-pyrroline-5-carboxylate dehydrogenase
VIGVASDELITDWTDTARGLEEAGLPVDCFQVIPGAALASVLQLERIQGVLVHARSRYLHAIARAVAERDGPVIPLISSVSPEMLLRQTLLEKTVSIDTTAAGGNASLMTMQ